jgi:uncharacterized protein YdaT
MAKGKDQHVVPHQDGWAVKGSGNSRATSIQPTQQKAIQDAVQIAKNQKSEVVIHGRDGKIRDKDSFGHDPFPPRDKKH